MNTFMNNLKAATNFTYTDNLALAHKSTNSAVYDMFALGGAYRNRDEADVIHLFKNAYEEDATLAMKCLFWMRDARGGAGERRFFRVAFKWLATTKPSIAVKYIEFGSEYGRWDDMIYATKGTAIFDDVCRMLYAQILLDIDSKTPSLLAKWMPSENASSQATKQLASAIRNRFHWSAKQYRKTLSTLRKKINIVERLMSENRWSEIEFDKIPSKAGLIYKNAFARRDIIAKKYEAFAKSENTKVNADALFPYEIVKKALDLFNSGMWYSRNNIALDNVDRLMINKYWANQKDYLNGADCSMMCVVDTSGSMTGGYNSTIRPIDVAISLGMYCAERLSGPFKNNMITFASEPQLLGIDGVDFCDSVNRIYRTNLVDNTNLEAVFDLLYSIAMNPSTRKEDIPKTIVVISDQQIDAATGSWSRNNTRWTMDNAATEMEKMRLKWQRAGLHFPSLIYWNVNASKDTILDAGPNVSFVSGASPSLFQSVLTGESGYSLMVKTLMSKRYEQII